MDFEKLGRYDIVRVLGKGAMGVVYEARDPNLDRQVAIKTIRVQGMSSEAASEYETRFRTEARSAARLHHPNIVSVFDSGQDGDNAYLVMEFIQGQDLKHHLECGARFSVRSAIAMVHDLLMALDHAHRQNVVHRDIKPANMLIEPTGRVKLTDFGVARIQEPDESHLTQVGGAVGTPKYMSPEQAKGQRGDSRSDVFSAAVVLYELLTGRLPFNGDNQFIIIHQIVSHDPPPPSSLNPDVPASMDAAMARALTKNPDERYATAREFALALREVAQQLPPSAGASPAPVTPDIGRQQAGPIVTAAADAALRDGSSTGIFGASVDAALMSTVDHEAELNAWKTIQNSFNQQDFVDFLVRFPVGIYARRAQQELDRLMARGQPDPDSTVASFAATLPQAMLTADATQQPVAIPPEASAPPLPEPAAPKPVPPATPPRRGKAPWLLGLAGVAVVALAAVAVLRPGTPAPVPEPAPIPVPVAKAPVEEIIESTPAPAQTQPASTPVRPAPAVASSAPAKAALAARPIRARPSAPEVAPAPAPAPVHAAEAAESAGASAGASGRLLPRRGVGPSQPGQVCAEKVFVFRIACVAEQCTTDRYRDTPECIRFHEMEKAREEQRAARRLSQ